MQNLRVSEGPSFFIKPSRKNEIIQSLKAAFPAAREDIINQAEQIYSHTFDLLGSGKKNVDVSDSKRTGYNRIDWHRDFIHDERWDAGIYYTDTRIAKKKYGSDIKVPWELSRCQHFPTLGKAYWLTNDERYIQEFVDEINDWIDNNLPQHGVNWTCTMDVAIRAVNWIWGYYYFKDSTVLTDDFLLKFLKSLIVHGRHIMGNLEQNLWGINTNHYLSDIVGLVYLGVMFPEFKEANKWREFGIKELVKEMKVQVYSDGVNYEGSISYHRLVTRSFPPLSSA